MSMAMDAASGISDARWQQVQEQAEHSLLWRAHNLPFPDVNAHLGVADLGVEFRKPLQTDIPTLILSGSLDGRTFVESHREIVSGFSNASLVTIERAGHNLFLSSPEVLPMMQSFFAGKMPVSATIELPELEFE